MFGFICFRQKFFLQWSAALLFASGLLHAQNPETETERRFAEMTALIQKLQARVDDLEARLNAPKSTAVVVSTPAPEAPAAPAAAATAASPAKTDLLRGTTVNFLLDGYYGYNLNKPIGRVNLLRAYDVSSNAFSLNQAAIVIENAADPEHGRRFGGRLDLQFGQATETLQGNNANELRPNVWRNVFQAYGTYVAPVGTGLTVDFGKWASSLGMEGNYTKDQINYSRSYWFDFLPFYHEGARVSYKLNDAVTANYWITNGTQQTEPFNNFKDQLFGFTAQPGKTVSWTMNYYLGQEHPDVLYLPGNSTPGLPSLQGIPFQPIANAPKGKLHILDSYVNWQASPKLSLALEGDYLIERLTTSSAPDHTVGGAAYSKYQLTPRTAIAGRAEYLSDRGGLLTGRTQTIKETTVTYDQRLGDGFLLREEWRRDWSNHPYFLTDTLGILKKSQNTLTLGVVWWFGSKDGGW